MKIRLFWKLINYVATQEEKAYRKIWGSRLLARFRGKPKTFSKISTVEAKKTKKGYKKIKSMVKPKHDIDDLILLCDRGIAKYNETSGFFKNLRLLILVAGLIFANAFAFQTVMKVNNIDEKVGVTIDEKCLVKDQYEACEKEAKRTAVTEIEAVTRTAKWQALVFSIVISIVGLLVIGIISNDNKGKLHLQVLSLYLNRLKKERDSSEAKNADQ